MSRPSLTRWLLVATTVLALVLAAWLAQREGASLEQISEAGRRIPGPVLAGVFGLSLVNYLLRFRRWELLLGPASATLTRPRHLLIYIAGFSLTLTPAKAGEALRTLYLMPHGVPPARSLMSLGVERVLDVMAVAVLAILVVALWPRAWAIVVPTLVGGAVLLAVVARLARSGAADAQAAWLPGPMSRLVGATARSFQSLGAGTLLRAFLLSLAGWAMEAAGLVVLAKYLSPEVSAAAVAGIFGAAVLAGALTFLPGGLGGTELVMIALLSSAGLSASEAALATAVCRLATLWFGFGLGLLALPVLGADRRRRIV